MQRLWDHPFDNPAECLAIQETLIFRIVAIERRIERLKRQIKESKDRPSVRPPNKLRAAQSQRIQSRVRRDQQTLKEYKQLLYILRSVGDALAFTYLPKYDVKVMSGKPSSGFIYGKKGFVGELFLLREIFNFGDIAILNDLTNSLRYGDITTIRIRDGKIAVIELKIGRHDYRRAERQVAGSKRLEKYLGHHDYEKGFYEDGTYVMRAPLHSEERDHVDGINQLIETSLKSGYALKEMEDGLYYYVEAGIDGERLRSTTERYSESASPIFVNSFKYSNVGYVPFILSIRNPEALFRYYAGQILIVFFVDMELVRAKFGANGLVAEFEKDNEWAITLRYIDPDLDQRFGSVRTSRHFFNRLPVEFLSLDWFLEQLISGFRNVQNAAAPPAEV